ncbi:transcriptional regulator [Bordetella ansorpii]
MGQKDDDLDTARGPSYPGLLHAMEAAGGTQAALANVLGISQSAVHKMLRSKHPIDPRHCTKLERMLGIPRWYMRPTDYWTIWPDLPRLGAKQKARLAATRRR